MPKSLWIVICIAVAAVILSVGVMTGRAQVNVAPNGAIIPGRYQIVAQPNGSLTFLLDTQDGRTWRFIMGATPQGAPANAWESIPRLDTPDAAAAFARKVQPQ
jgi:hypothetical protein